MNKKCKFCGAKELFSENDYTIFECGTRRYGNNEWGKGIECAARLLAHSESRVRELFEEIDDFIWMFQENPDIFSVGDELKNKGNFPEKYV